MTHTVIGVFDTKDSAMSAKRALQSASISNSDTSSFGERGKYDSRHASATDSIYAFFSNLFDDDDDTARGYAEVARRGTVVTVYADSMAQAKRAAAILDQHGAIDLDDRNTAYKGYEDKDLNDDTIKVIEENIAVGKREVETGSATIRSRIVEKPVVETLRLREENIVIERVAVDRPATAADFNSTGTVTLTETAEEAVVSKNARVVEEIRLGKEQTTRTETVKETLRETEVDIVKKDGHTVRTHNEKK